MVVTFVDVTNSSLRDVGAAGKRLLLSAGPPVFQAIGRHYQQLTNREERSMPSLKVPGYQQTPQEHLSWANQNDRYVRAPCPWSLVFILKSTGECCASVQPLSVEDWSGTVRKTIELTTAVARLSPHWTSYQRGPD
ncbi:hypothetical protein RRG08_000665 [Elysia crispata]|uniref:Uncharacterized protein n=1 Tax=Elysia crispata TaxID=231223 RepID=A0AAE0Y9J3_9GAST|nr:hypothetical protein RRG08_000665 [Elysia crispata]